MITFVRGRAAVAAAVLGLSIVGVPAEADAADDFLPEIADSAVLSTPPVAEGVVRSESGELAAGARVILLAWPSLEHLSVGDSVKTQPVAKASTDKSGRFILRIGGLEVLKPLASPTGRVDLEAVAYADGVVAPFHFSRSLSIDQSGLRLADQESSPASAEKIALTLQKGRTPGAVPSSTTTPSAMSGLKKGCSSWFEQDFGPRWVPVGHTSSSTFGVRHDFSYSRTAESTLGVGVHGASPVGGWTFGGTSTRSSTGGINFPAQGDHHGALYDTQFRYGKFMVMCATPPFAASVWHEASPMEWVAGSRVRPVGWPKATYCSTNAKGSTFWLDRSRSITWSDGVDIGAELGIGLLSQTGFTQQAKVSYKFAHKKRLCGTNGYPGGTPLLLQARRLHE